MVQNHAVIIHGKGDVRVEERPEPTPKEGQVQVKIERGGICGSDLSYYAKGAVGNFKVKHPMVLGHEVVGIVSATGGGVDSGLVGTRVAVDPSTPCMTCARCLEGRFNACLSPVFLGSASTDPHVDGGFSSLLVANSQNAVVFPEQLDVADIVFAEPLAVNVHAINRAGGVKSKRVLIVGAGPIGSILAAAVVRLGASEVAVTDLDPSRLERVKQMGVHVTAIAGKESPGTDFDIVFEASGSVPGIVSAMEATRKAGTLVMVGLPHGGPLNVPLGLTVTKEFDLMGSFRFNHDEFVQAVQLLGDGLDLSALHTDTFHAHDAPDAFVKATNPESMKVQLNFADS